MSQPIDPAERPADRAALHASAADRPALPDSAVDASAMDAEDRRWMNEALAAAREAEAADEVPIGAVIVLDGECIGRGSNCTRSVADPTGHAEMHAIRAAARHVGAQRIVGATVYTTVEPCFMCAGALLHARVARVVWGVRDPKFGACASLGNVLSDDRLNHQIEISEGICADEARSLLVEFFQSKRRASAQGRIDPKGS